MSYSLGVASPHLEDKILRAALVNFSRFFPRFHSVLVNFSQSQLALVVNFGQF